jgi:hypothetical protein
MSKNCGKCGRQLPVPGDYAESILNLQETDDGEALSLDSSGVPLPENIKFLKKILENTANGLLTFEEADEMIAPFWNQVIFVEEKLKNNVQPVVNTLKDSGLTGSQERFLEIIADFKELLQGVFTAIDNKDETAVGRFAAEVAQTGVELYNLSLEIEAGMNKAAH